MRALVIGFGSIGQRHAQILDSMDQISQVFVLSSRELPTFEQITSLQEIPALDPDYVVIASNTALHFQQLMFLEKHLQARKILVEKPLFDTFRDIRVRQNQVFVGYNLRFHPLLQKLKGTLAGRRLWNIQVFCGSYLPDWRPDKDYRKSYSAARKESGGGVLLDLSHELDYLQWLAGAIKVGHVVNEKISDLEINGDDLLLLTGQTEDGAHVHVSLNYFTRKPLRQLLIDGEGISIQGDLVAPKLFLVENGEASDYSWPDLERNDTYRSQHTAILENDSSSLCTYEEGLETMRLIDHAHAFGNS